MAFIVSSFNGLLWKLASLMFENIGILVEADPGPGILYQLTGVIAQHGANITSVDIVEARQTYFEMDVTDGPALLADLARLPIVHRVTHRWGRLPSARYRKPTGTIFVENTSRWIRSPLSASSRWQRRCGLARGCHG